MRGLFIDDLNISFQDTSQVLGRSIEFYCAKEANWLFLKCGSITISIWANELLNYCSEKQNI